MHRKNSRIPSWVLAVLFILTLSVVGWGISKFAGTFIPLWILFGFSLIFSIEKWLYHGLKKYKAIGVLYRIFLNLSILFIIGVIIWAGINLFSMKFTQIPLIGSLIFIGELIFFIWLWRVVRRNNWRQPSMKLTVFSLLAIAIIFSFAGVQPLFEYKNKVIEKISTFIEMQKQEAEKRSVEEKAGQIDRLRDLGVSDPSTVVEELSTNKELKLGLEVLEKANIIRKERGSSELQWDDTLYKYSKSHSEEMAKRKQLFHTAEGMPYAENAWGGEGSMSWTAKTIVDSWMGSDLHRTWLLCPNLKHVAVGVAISSTGMYASWTFWVGETDYYTDWWYCNGSNKPPSWWY